MKGHRAVVADGVECADRTVFSIRRHPTVGTVPGFDCGRTYLGSVDSLLDSSPLWLARNATMTARGLEDLSSKPTTVRARERSACPAAATDLTLES
jgi:hypothetical protein